MNTVIKAIRATILLGDIELDVLQFPDGSYHLFINQLNQELSIKASDSTGKKYLQPLIDKEPNRVNQASVEGIKSNLKTLSIDLVSEAIQAYAQIGNQKCIAIAIACLAESLERRADAAFNVIRTEAERNERLDTRISGILSRYFWTDLIDAYIRSHEVSDNYKRFVYVNVSDSVNRALFGKSAKQVREHYGLRPGDSIREFLPTESLKLIDTIEKASGVRVQNNDICPKQAIKDVVSLLGIEPDSSRLG